MSARGTLGSEGSARNHGAVDDENIVGADPPGYIHFFVALKEAVVDATIALGLPLQDVMLNALLLEIEYLSLESLDPCFHLIFLGERPIHKLP